MPNDAAITNVLVGFLLVLTRLGAFFIFIPIPGSRSFAPAPKIVLTLSAALMLSRSWPLNVAPDFPGIAVALASEAALGISAGTGLALIIEAMQLTGQFIGLQAGYSYASTIDPNSQADSGLLLILCQLLTSMIIFSTGLDREILKTLALSFEHIPAGTYHMSIPRAMGVLAIGSTMFHIGLRLALPVISVLLIADISLALLGKIEQHLQLSNLLFPVKMLSALAILAVVVHGSARLIEQWLGDGWRSVYEAVGF